MTDNKADRVRGAPEAPKQVTFSPYPYFGKTLLEILVAILYHSRWSPEGPRIRPLVFAIKLVVFVIALALSFQDGEIAGRRLWINVAIGIAVLPGVIDALLWVSFGAPLDRRGSFVALDLTNPGDPRIYRRIDRQKRHRLTDINDDGITQPSAVKNFLIGMDKLWRSLKWPMEIIRDPPESPASPGPGGTPPAPASPTPVTVSPTLPKWTVCPQTYILREVSEFVLFALLLGATFFIIDWVWLAPYHPRLPPQIAAGGLGVFFALVRSIYQRVIESNIGVVFDAKKCLLHYRYRVVGFFLQSTTVYLRDIESLSEICRDLASLSETDGAFRLRSGRIPHDAEKHARRIKKRR